MFTDWRNEMVMVETSIEIVLPEMYSYCENELDSIFLSQESEIRRLKIMNKIHFFPLFSRDSE